MDKTIETILLDVQKKCPLRKITGIRINKAVITPIQMYSILSAIKLLR